MTTPSTSGSAKTSAASCVVRISGKRLRVRARRAASRSATQATSLVWWLWKLRIRFGPQWPAPITAMRSSFGFVAIMARDSVRSGHLYPADFVLVQPMEPAPRVEVLPQPVQLPWAREDVASEIAISARLKAGIAAVHQGNATDELGELDLFLIHPVRGVRARDALDGDVGAAASLGDGGGKGGHHGSGLDLREGIFEVGLVGETETQEPGRQDGPARSGKKSGEADPGREGEEDADPRHTP